MARFGRHIWLVLAIVAAVLGGSLASVVGMRLGGYEKRGSVRDVRAYPVDSGMVNFNEALERTGIRVPACLSEVRYAFYYEGYSYYQDFYMKALGSEGCMNDFLVGNRMQSSLQGEKISGPEEDRPLNPRPSWIDDAPVPDLGWMLGPAMKFQRFSVGNPGGYSVEVLIERLPDMAAYRAYLYANRMH